MIQKKSDKKFIFTHHNTFVSPSFKYINVMPWKECLPNSRNSGEARQNPLKGWSGLKTVLRRFFIPVIFFGFFVNLLRLKRQEACQSEELYNTTTEKNNRRTKGIVLNQVEIKEKEGENVSNFRAQIVWKEKYRQKFFTANIFFVSVNVIIKTNNKDCHIKKELRTIGYS